MGKRKGRGNRGNAVAPKRIDCSLVPIELNPGTRKYRVNGKEITRFRSNQDALDEEAEREALALRAQQSQTDSTGLSQQKVRRGKR